VRDLVGDERAAHAGTFRVGAAPRWVRGDVWRVEGAVDDQLRRPSNRPGRLTGPSGPSKRYSLSTAIHGIRRRLAASASRARVSFFSSASSSSRAASTPAVTRSAESSSWPVLPQVLLDDAGRAPPQARVRSIQSVAWVSHSGLEREPVGPAPIVRRSTPVSSSRRQRQPVPVVCPPSRLVHHSKPPTKRNPDRENMVRGGASLDTGRPSRGVRVLPAAGRLPHAVFGELIAGSPTRSSGVRNLRTAVSAENDLGTGVLLGIPTGTGQPGRRSRPGCSVRVFRELSR
jgi:hypothetical protein